MAATQQQLTDAHNESVRTLVNNAVECTYYVAHGKCLRDDLMTKYGMTKGEAEHRLAVITNSLVRHIKDFKFSNV